MNRDKESLYRAATVVIKASFGAALAYALYEIYSGRCPETGVVCAYTGALTTTAPDAIKDIYTYRE